MKKLVSLAILSGMVISLAACSNNVKETKSEDTSNLQLETTKEQEATQEQETTTEVKSDGYEKFSQLKIGMTESEVNAILGEPKKVDKAYYYYDIVVNGNILELNVWINTVTGKLTYASGDFSHEEYRDEFIDEKTDLSHAKDLEDEKLKTYDDCVSAFKTSGYLIAINEDDKKSYLWVDSNKGNLTVDFNADGKIISYRGYC